MRINRFKKFLIVGLVAVLILLAWISMELFRPFEPRYQGRKLTDWLELHQKAFGKPYQRGSQGGFLRSAESSKDIVASEEAVRSIGTNGIPTLLRLLESEDSMLMLRFVNLASRQSLVRITHQRAEVRRALGRKGLRILGDEALKAVPELIRMTRTGSRTAKYEAMACLFELSKSREQEVPILTELLQNPDPSIRLYTAHRFHQHYPAEAAGAGVYLMFPEILNERGQVAPFRGFQVPGGLNSLAL